MARPFFFHLCPFNDINERGALELKLTADTVHFDEFVLVAVFATPIVDLGLSRKGSSTDIDPVVSFGGVVVANHK